MNRIFTWDEKSNNGAFQKETELGVYSGMLLEKPNLSFVFNTVQYIEFNNTYTVDGGAMTQEQKTEIEIELGEM